MTTDLDNDDRSPPTRAETPSAADRVAVSDDDEGSLSGLLIDGRLSIKEKLGEGGMGEVYRAYHTMMKKDLAFKVLRPEFGTFPQLVARFKREAMSASRLDHPGIVRIHDFGQTEDGLLFLVMELVKGQELSDLLEHEPKQPESRVVAIGRAICSALTHAHDNGVVHRDLKPDNIIIAEPEGDQVVTDSGASRVKILDFGVAKILEGDGPGGGENLTQAGAVFGTPAYMSPEQATGDVSDGRSDIYSLGIMMYEMLAGRRPFKAETQAKLIRKQIKDPPPPLSEVLGPGVVSPHVEAAVSRALEKEPEDRFQSAAEMNAALASGHTDPALAATVPAARGRAGQGKLWLGGGIGAVLIVGVVIGLLFAGGDKKKDDDGEDTKAAAPTVDAAPAPVMKVDPWPNMIKIEEVKENCLSHDAAKDWFKKGKKAYLERTKRDNEYARRVFHGLLRSRGAWSNQRRHAAYFLTKIYIRKRACPAARKTWRLYRRFYRSSRKKEPPPFPGCP